METRDLPLSGDAISGHLHKATTSLHSLLIVYANDGFDSLAADELQSTLLQLVSNVTSAFRLFTQHQKQHEALSRQAADAIETITRLSPLIKEQQDQIKSLRDELESSKSIEVAQSRSTCSVSTATDLNVSAMEEQILVMKTELWLKDTLMAEEKQKYVSAMESLKKKLTKSRSQTAAVVEDTGRVIEAQAIVIGELRDEVNKLMGDCNSLRKTLRTREGPARFVDVASAGINTELNCEINGTGFQSAASSTQYPEIFGNVISKASTDADGLSIDGTVDASLQPKYSYPIAREKRLDSKLSSMLYESNKLSKSKPLNETPIEEAHPFDAFGEAYYRNEAESSVSSTESRALDLSIEGRNFIESDRIDEYNDFDKVDETVWQGKSLDRYTDRNAESDDDGNFDVQFSTSGKYVVRPSTKARYIDEASDDGGECQSISSTKECDEDTKSLLYLETGNISTVETGDATKDDNDMSKISLSCWPRALLASSISVEDSFAMIQNYYS